MKFLRTPFFCAYICIVFGRHTGLNFKKDAKKRKNMLDMRQAVNRFGIEVKKCCASCAFKSITNDVALRRCNLHRHKVRPHNCCRAWRMSEGLRHAGEKKPLPQPLPRREGSGKSQ